MGSPGTQGLPIASYSQLDWNTPEPVEPFAPINVELHPDPQQQQRLVVTWNFGDGAQSSGLYVTFHLQVARSRNRIIILEEYYNTNLSGAGKPFRWTWDSELPLECDSHSVRIRSGLPYEEHWSAWSQWKTLYGKNGGSRRNIEIYPHEKLVLEGSNVTFCCLPRSNDNVKEMTFKNKVYPNQAQLMNTDAFVITVKNVSMTLSDGDNVICKVNPRDHNGTVLIVSRPPNAPKDFFCESWDLQTLHCSWNPGPIHNFRGGLKESYTLQEWVSGNWVSCARDHCTWPVVGSQQIYNFKLTVRNPMGEKSLQAAVNVKERVKPVVPNIPRVSNVNATNAVLHWTMAVDYTSVMLHCQADLQRSTVNATFNGKPRLVEYSMSLTQLEPFTKYEPRVRCMAESSLAGWSNWSKAGYFQAREDVPSAPVDVWREVLDNRNSRLVTLYWKHLPDFSANGNISHFNIKWWSLQSHMAPNRTQVPAAQTQYKISLGRGAHIISITAQNGAGKSPAAKIKIPESSDMGFKEVNTERTSGKDGEMNVSWTPVPDVAGYVVEWCSFPRSPHCDLQWKKYNSSIHSDVIKSDVFQPGVRYEFRIYGSKEDGEHLLGKLTGYTKELVSSRTPQVKVTKFDGVSLSLDWSPYPNDETQEGFVAGYIFYVKSTEGKCKMEKSEHYTYLDDVEMCKGWIDDPDTVGTTILGLKSSPEYEVAVTAVTGEGETAKKFVKVAKPRDAGPFILSILLPVILVSVLAVILLIAGRAWLKEICYPDVPDPNKSKVLSSNSPMVSHDPKIEAKKSVLSRIQKAPDNRCVMPAASSLAQKEEPVHILENIKDICNELKESCDQREGENYATIQRTNNGESSESSADMYMAANTEHGSPNMRPSEKLFYNRQSPTYLEFFNQNYNGTPDDTSEDCSILGYRPQMDTTQHESYARDPKVSVCLPYRDFMSQPDLSSESFSYQSSITDIVVVTNFSNFSQYSKPPSWVLYSPLEDISKPKS
ncbi:oncostatin-M-specific receptor subunit beta [Gastrophryne carolinensis]